MGQEYTIEHRFYNDEWEPIEFYGDGKVVTYSFEEATMELKEHFELMDEENMDYDKGDWKISKYIT